MRLNELPIELFTLQFVQLGNDVGQCTFDPRDDYCRMDLITAFDFISF